MKKITLVSLLAALVMMALPARAQVAENESGIVYYMPYTEICIDVEYEEISLTKGPFYQYSERYLGTKDIITENGVKYQIRSINLRTKTSADRSRSYVFNPGKKHVSLTREGLLFAIGDELPKADKPTEKKKEKAAKIMGKNSEIENQFAGLLEEQMLASSISKMAEGVAKQIYHIRESRINWLTGEVDHMPADGKSLEMILKQLDRQEKQLTSLFLGKETHKTLHKTICIDPKEMTDEVVFRFSEIQGIVDADDLSGEPFYMTAVVTKSTYNTEETKKKTAESPIFYNLPGSIYLTLTDGTRCLMEKTFAVGQFGISVALPAATFKGAETILFCPKSGALLSVE